MSEQARNEAEKDAYPPDTEFGRSAAEDAERVDQADRAEGTERVGDVTEELPRDDIRAASKADPAGEETDPVNQQSEDSFPASDPPQSH